MIRLTVKLSVASLSALLSVLAVKVVGMSIESSSILWFWKFSLAHTVIEH